MLSASRLSTAAGSSTVLASVASGFADYVKGEGVDVDDLFERSALKTDWIADPTRAICLRSFLGVMDSAAGISGNDNLGLWFGKQFQPEYLGHLGYLALSSATVGDALVNMTRYFHLFQRQSNLRLTPYRGKVRLEYVLHDAAIVSRRHDAELTMGTITSVIKRALGPQWGPEEVHFTHSAPDAWRDHNKVFRSDVLFNQDANGILLRSSDLAKPMPGADAQLQTIVLHSFRMLHDEQAVPVRVADRVRTAILEVIDQGCPRLEDIAESMNVPAWTLGRQLKEEGTGFSLLVESVRKDLAAHYLQNTSVSISKVAGLLGYTEMSSFSHAFVRWFGDSPKRWRELRR